MKQVLSTLAALLLALPCAAQAVKTDLAVYAVPPLARPAKAGDKVVDPVFGADIMRVTDERDGAHLGTHYSYWRTFNKDNSLLLIANPSNGTGFIRRFDPLGFKLGEKLDIAPVPEGGQPTLEGATWSGTDPDVLLCTAWGKLYAYRVSARRYETIAEASMLPAGEGVVALSIPEDDQVWAFTRKRWADNSFPGVGVYDRRLGKLSHKIDIADLDEVTISKSGKFLLIKLGNQGAGKVESVAVNLATGARVEVIDNTDYAPGHGDAGADSYVGYDNWRNQINWRSLAEPKTVRTLLQIPDWNVGAFHVSMRADDESWALVETFGGTDDHVLRNEVFQVATDGSQRIRRLFHHRSIYRTYYDSPRCNISRDGRFVACTSNWGGDRLDLYVAKITPAPSLSAPPAPTPTPFPTPSPFPVPVPSPVPVSPIGWVDFEWPTDVAAGRDLMKRVGEEGYTSCFIPPSSFVMWCFRAKR